MSGTKRERLRFMQETLRKKNEYIIELCDDLSEKRQRIHLLEARLEQLKENACVEEEPDAGFLLSGAQIELKKAADLFYEHGYALLTGRGLLDLIGHINEASDYVLHAQVQIEAEREA